MPDIHSYARVFDWFKVDSRALYMGRVDDETTVRMLEHLAALAVHRCQVNDELPDMFIDPLRKLHRRDPEAVRFFEDADKRAFFLSDLLDFVSLFSGNRRRDLERPHDE